MVLKFSKNKFGNRVEKLQITDLICLKISTFHAMVILLYVTVYLTLV